MKNCWKVGVVVLLLIIALCSCSKSYGEQQYDKAVAAINDGNYWDAYSLLKTISETDDKHDDSVQLMNDIREKAFADNRRNAYLGGTVYFGAYEQDGNIGNGKEDIEWRVIGKENDRILLISEYVLDYQPFATTTDEATWKNSYIRKWLNSTFFDEAFTNNEKSLITDSQVLAHKHPDYDMWKVDPGVATEDKVFLLSAREFENPYLNQRTNATQYSKYKMLEHDWSNSDQSWWLRTPSISYRHISAVNHDGEEFSVDIFTFEGLTARPTEAFVRPAIWITLD